MTRPMDGVKVQEFARTMARWFRNRGAPERVMDDVESIAALSAVETYRRKGFQLDAQHWNYFFRAAMCDVAEEMKHVLAPFRVGGREARAGRFTLPAVLPFGSRQPEDEVEVMASIARPPETPDDAFDRRDRERARARVVARVLGHARGLDPRVRRNASHLLRAIAPRLRAPRRRPSKNAQWNAVRALRNVVAGNALARRDRCVMIGVEELTA